MCSIESYEILRYREISGYRQVSKRNVAMRVLDESTHHSHYRPTLTVGTGNPA